MDVRWVGEGTGEHDTFQDFQEQAWTVGKTVASRCGGVDRAGHESLKGELESGV